MRISGRLAAVHNAVSLRQWARANRAATVGCAAVAGLAAAVGSPVAAGVALTASVAAWALSRRDSVDYDAAAWSAAAMSDDPVLTLAVVERLQTMSRRDAETVLRWAQDNYPEPTPAVVMDLYEETRPKDLH